jgi:phosphoribosylformylglycinamidine (FGAM) synthase PurS component
MAEFTFGVTVMPRKEVLDTQGRAVEETLKREGEPVLSCRVGRFVELKVSASDRKQAELTAKKVAESLLCNSLIETFTLGEANG